MTRIRNWIGFAGLIKAKQVSIYQKGFDGSKKVGYGLTLKVKDQALSILRSLCFLQ